MGISFPQEKHRGVKITPLAQGPGGKDTLAIKNLVHFQRGLYQLYQLYQLYHLYCCSSSYIKRGALTGLSQETFQQEAVSRPTARDHFLLTAGLGLDAA